MIFPCTAAAFTSPHILQTGFVMLCSLTQGFGLICDFCPSARRFALRLLSDIGSPLSPCLRLVLFKVVRMTPFWKMYRGLTPHKIMPMPGTHKWVEWTRGAFGSFSVCGEAYSRGFVKVHGCPPRHSPMTLGSENVHGIQILLR